MAGQSTYDTQSLTRASLELVHPQYRRWPLQAALAIVLIAAGVLAAWPGPGPFSVPMYLVSLRQENARLQSDLDHVQLELRVEQATNAELERRLQALSDRVVELNQQLEFVNTRTSRRPMSHRPAGSADPRQEG